MRADSLTTKLQVVEKEFPSLYLPTDPTRLSQTRTMGDDYMRAFSRCGHLSGDEVVTLLHMLERADVEGDRLLSCLMVRTSNLLGDSRENRRAFLPEVISRLVHHFSDRYGFGVIATRMSVFCGKEMHEIMHSVLGPHLHNRAPDSATLVNAIHFYRYADQKAYTSLLRQAFRMSENRGSSEYMFEIGELLHSDTMTMRVIGGESSYHRTALWAYAWMKKAVGRQNDQETRLLWTIRMAKVCYEARRFVEATRYSHELLNVQSSPQDARGNGYVVHAAKTVLGLVALAEGDVGHAKELLLNSLMLPPCPAMDAFGPSLRLAEELHCRGETEFIISFLHKCIGQFPSHKEEFAGLVSALETGSRAEWGPFNFY